jgi:CheY-like chemotaxis protein
MGGRVWVESELGHGSVFHFKVHFQVQADAADENKIPLLSGVRVLVVDDSRTNRIILREMLSSRGAEVEDVEDGPAALEHIKRAKLDGIPYQLILLDRRMPGMDGFHVAEQLGQQRAQGLIVMMLSCDDLKLGIARVHELGLEAYLVKPIRRSELFETIRTAMANQAPAPIAIINKPEAASALPLMNGAVADTRATIPLNILLADDSPDNRLLVHAYLRNTGYLLDDAENGVIALAKVKAGNYDLVLMDVQMPMMDGLEATRAIREWERELDRPRLPIFALTASAVEEDVKRSRVAGMDQHISKPIKKGVLLVAIKGVKKYSAASVNLPHDAIA